MRQQFRLKQRHIDLSSSLYLSSPDRRQISIIQDFVISPGALEKILTKSGKKML